MQLSGDSVRALVDTLASGELHAAAPTRVLDRTGCSRAVRWYYDVWEQLPQVQEGLFGRGAFALSEEGQARVSALPPLMSDDLAASEVFRPHERRVVAEASARVVPARRMRDLIRRRARIEIGGVQADTAGARDSRSRTQLVTLVRMSARSPRLAVRMPIFLGVGLLARLQARRAIRAGDFDTWLRDESSRE